MRLISIIIEYLENTSMYVYIVPTLRYFVLLEFNKKMKKNIFIEYNIDINVNLKTQREFANMNELLVIFQNLFQLRSCCDVVRNGRSDVEVHCDVVIKSKRHVMSRSYTRLTNDVIFLLSKVFRPEESFRRRLFEINLLIVFIEYHSLIPFLTKRAYSSMYGFQ